MKTFTFIFLLALGLDSSAVPLNINHAATSGTADYATTSGSSVVSGSALLSGSAAVSGSAIFCANAAWSGSSGSTMYSTTSNYSNTSGVAALAQTLSGAGNIVTHNTSEFAPSFVVSSELWVDPAYTGTSTGTINQPFKTVAAAISAITGPWVIHLAPNASYTANNPTFPNYPGIIYGNNSWLTVTGTATVQNDLTSYDHNVIGTVAYSGSSTNRYRLTGGQRVGNVFVNGGFLDNFSTTQSSGTLTVSGSASMSMINTISMSPVVSDGVTYINNSNFNTGKPVPLIKSTAGFLSVKGTLVTNTGTGGGISCDNGATTTPNLLSENAIVVAGGAPVTCGNAATIYGVNTIAGGVNTGSGLTPVVATATQGSKTDILYANASGSQSVAAIPNCALWLSPDQLMNTIADGASVSTPIDISGKSVVLTTSTTKPVFKVGGINGLPALYFGGSSSITGSGFFDSSYNAGITVFMVAAITGTTNAGANNMGMISSSDGRFGIYDAEFKNNFGFQARGFGDSLSVGMGNVAEPTMYEVVVSATTSEIGINGKVWQTGGIGGTLGLSGNLVIGVLSGFNQINFQGMLGEVLIFKGALNAQQRTVVRAYLREKYRLNRRQVICIGDSLTGGQYASHAGTISHKIQNSIGGFGEWHVANCGVSNRTAGEMAALCPTAWVPAIRPGVENIAIVWAGINDANMSATASQIYTLVQNICAPLTAAGYKTVVSTLLPFGSGTNNTNEVARSGFNALLRANHSFCSAIADIGADPTIGVDGSQNNQTYYEPNAGHLIDAGYDVAVPYFVRAINFATGKPMTGVVTLTSGSATVGNPNVTSKSSVFFTLKTPSGTVGAGPSATTTSGTRFTVSAAATDNSTYGYQIVEMP